MIDGYVHPAFARLAHRFGKDVGGDSPGGGALCVTLRGQTLVDVWAGTQDRDGTVAWTADTPVMCFSTTKGFAATVVHRLVDRGELDVDQKVGDVWPDFATNGKEDFTVRQVLSHRVGLHDMTRLVDDAGDMLDHDAMIDRLAAASPHPSLVGRPAYHGMTFGWLVAGIVRGVTGKDLATLFREELAAPLGVDGIHLGRPASGSDPAELVYNHKQFTRLGPLTERVGKRVNWVRMVGQSLIVPGFDELLADPSQPVLDTQWASANGTFTARGAATMYSALAMRGRHEDGRFLGRSTVHEAGRVQTPDRDAVLGLPMRWRLGYHAALVRGRRPSKAFGHFGYGGSGAWADPTSGLAVAFVTNRLGNATTPIADARMVRYGSEALRAVRDLPTDGELAGDLPADLHAAG